MIEIRLSIVQRRLIEMIHIGRRPVWIRVHLCRRWWLIGVLVLRLWLLRMILRLSRMRGLGRSVRILLLSE